MKYLSSSSTMALMAGFASSRLHHVHSSSVVVSSDHKILSNINEAADHHRRNLQAGPVTLQQLELIQYIIRLISQAALPEGIDLTQVNVAIIITEVLQELGIDASTSIGDLSAADMELIVQEIITKAADILGVVTNATLPTATTTTVVATEPCSICGDGMKVGNPLANLNLPGQPEVACGALETAGANGVIPSEQCVFLPSLVTDVCECIPDEDPVDVVTTTTTVAPTDTGPSCVCSPLSYTFTIDLNRNCDPDKFTDSPGISNSVCQMLLNPFIGEDGIESSDNTLTVYDVQFLEVDTSGNLIVINQDDTYNNVTLTTGDTITFDSVSAKLNPDEPLSSQLNYVPGGVLMKFLAKSEGSETIVRQNVSWLYTNACDILPTSVGDAIGWITLTDQTEASQAFCPVASSAMPTLSPTKTATVSPTTSPVAATDPPTTSPTQSPTPAPVASTDPPTSSPTKNPTPSPVAATDPPTTSPTKSPIASIQDPPTSSPTKSPTLSPVPDPTTEPTLAPITSSPTKANAPTTTPTPPPTTFGKAAKAKASKADPLAKTIKESSSDGTKSSKADILAKAFKQGDDDSVSTPAFAKAAKTKQQKISSKSTKSTSNFISKGNKGQKENTPSSKSSKKQSSSADAKAQKISSKAPATDPLSMMI